MSSSGADETGFQWAAAASPPVMSNGPNSFTTINPAHGSPQAILGNGTNYQGLWASAKRFLKSGAELKLAIDAGLTGALVLNCSGLGKSSDRKASRKPHAQFREHGVRRRRRALSANASGRFSLGTLTISVTWRSSGLCALFHLWRCICIFSWVQALRHQMCGGCDRSSPVGKGETAPLCCRHGIIAIQCAIVP